MSELEMEFANVRAAIQRGVNHQPGFRSLWQERGYFHARDSRAGSGKVFVIQVLNAENL